MCYQLVFGSNSSTMYITVLITSYLAHRCWTWHSLRVFLRACIKVAAFPTLTCFRIHVRGANRTTYGPLALYCSCVVTTGSVATVN
jgi:hypothetical protein